MSADKETLEKGLPTYDRTTKCKVVIAGAGMAGLVAAWLLRRARYEVRLLEASHRVGGRVRTLRSGFSSGLYAEAGAMRIPAHHELTLWLCKHLGLKTIDFDENCPSGRVYINGHRERLREYDAGRAFFGDPYKRGRHARKIVNDVLRHVSSIYNDEDRQPELDRFSWGEYLLAFRAPRGKGIARNVVTGKRIPEGEQLTEEDIDLVAFDLWRFLPS